MSLLKRSGLKARAPFALRLALVCALAGLTGGCFQPLYGDRSFGSVGGVGPALNGVEVVQINAPNGTSLARIAVEARNQLIFNLTGGGPPPPPTHRLLVNLSTTASSVIVDITTARPDLENYGIDANFTLTEVASNKVVLTGRTFSRVTYDIPGQQQRFARDRARRDAENRAAQVIADQVRSRLASYFVTGG